MGRATRGIELANVKEILATAIEFERFGSEYYSKLKDLVADEKAKVLMKSLATDEKEHASILEIELTNHGGKPKKTSKELLKKGFAEMFPEKIKKNSIATKDAISAIKLGIRTEERSIMFYSKNRASSDKKLAKILAKLEKMELAHLALLEENLVYLQSDGSWYGYVPILD